MSETWFAASNRRRLVLKAGRERVVANRHPWIFAGAIVRESGPDDAPVGDLVDERGAVLASGFYSRDSQIRLRALTFEGEELTPDLLHARIRASVKRRESILDADTDAARIIHSEGDELSGIVVDRYGDLLVVEISNRGAEKLRTVIVEGLGGAFEARAMYFKNDLPARKLENLPLESELVGIGEARTTFRESGLVFEVDPREGQKTGFFLDQRDNRRLARTQARGKRALNLFSYTGAFGVYMAAGGAAHVENVDVSAPAIDQARRHHELNGSADRASFVVADAFQYVRARAAAGESFDFIVCDPPAFAKSRGEVDRAARGYKDINLYALRLASPGARIMTFSCSGHVSNELFQKIIFSAAHDAGRRVSFVQRLGAGGDHPVSLYCPEGEYLKGFLLEVHD